MTERQLQFRVGLLVIAAGIVAAALVFRFGEARWLWEKNYSVAIHFDKAPGVERGTPVRKNGILIGSVREIAFDETRGGVNVVIDVRQRFLLRKDSRPMLSRSLLGDATLEFTPGTSKEFYRPGERIEGDSAEDPLQLVARIESRLNQTLDSFATTSDEWRKVGKNLNSLTETHRGSIDQVIERAAESLHQFSVTMQHANATFGDPQNQENLRKTLAALPRMVDETQQTIRAVHEAVVKADASLANLSEVTGPLAKRSNSIITKLDRTATNVESISAEMNQFLKLVNREEGSLKLLVSDPQLYRNLEQSAAALQTALKNLEPAIRDIRVFSDKVARHPELLGAGGALKGSSGLK